MVRMILDISMQRNKRVVDVVGVEIARMKFKVFLEPNLFNRFLKVMDPDE